MAFPKHECSIFFYVLSRKLLSEVIRRYSNVPTFYQLLAFAKRYFGKLPVIKTNKMKVCGFMQCIIKHSLRHTSLQEVSTRDCSAYPIKMLLKSNMKIKSYKPSENHKSFKKLNEVCHCRYGTLHVHIPEASYGIRKLQKLPLGSVLQNGN